MDRRTFVKAGAAGSLALLGGVSFTRSAQTAQLLGPLLGPDSNGVQLPAGFTSRIVAVSGELVGPTSYRWHPNPDGGATFAQPDGGWVYVSNDEANNGNGGVSMLRFDANANIVDARSILTGTNRNCAGGATPWNTWLSCEETDTGQVWECDPLGERAAQVRPAMGVFKHEAAAVDAQNQIIYLTEDQPDSALYRFAPEQFTDMSVGTLLVMTEIDGELGWQPVPDPTAATNPTRFQVPGTKRFNGGEGAWFDNGLLYFTTKGDNRVWTYSDASNELAVIYDRATSPTPVLSGVDNVTVSAAGDVYVCEDGGNMEVVVLTADGAVEPFLRIDIGGSELTGVAFDPSGTRMYVSSQRNPGTTYEITGPFAPVAEAPTQQPTPVEPSSDPRRVAGDFVAGRDSTMR